jgi:hypothetical protein
MMRIQQAINDRLERWSKMLSRHLADATDEFSWGRALSQSRDALRAILEFCSLPELPAEVRDALTHQVHGIVRSNQQTLEADASRELGGPGGRNAEMQLRQLRQNPLTAVIAEPLPDRSAGERSWSFGSSIHPQPTQGGISATSASGPRRRQILIDSVGDA